MEQKGPLNSYTVIFVLPSHFDPHSFLHARLYSSNPPNSIMRTNIRTMQKTTGCLSIYLEIFCFLTAMMLECLLSSTRPKLITQLMALQRIYWQTLPNDESYERWPHAEVEPGQRRANTTDGPCGWISGFKPSWWVPIAHPLCTSLQLGRVFNRTVI
jgi:hypothetical protein